MRKPLLLAIGITFAGALLVFPYLFKETRQIDYVAADPQAPEIMSDNIELLFVGDIMLSRKVGENIVASGDWRFPFLKIADFLGSADLTFANLENPVSNRGVKMGSIYSFRADPRTLEGLTYAGIDIVSLANNHIWDYGRDAFLDTMTYLDNIGISYVGAGQNFDNVHRGITSTVKGTKITYLAYTDLLSKQLAATATSPGVAYLDRTQMVKDIVQAKASSDFVIVSFHTGDEYETQHNQNQEVIFKEAIDAGASLVIGHHPHVVQEVEQYKNGWIAYSLGNFIFDQNFSEETKQGLALRVTLQNEKIESVESIPVYISALSQPSIKIK